jgi:hypothetical protein
MEQLGLLSNALGREPLAPLSEGAQDRVRALLARSPHVDLAVPVTS